MDFNQAMQETLKDGKYNRLMGRWIDWREWLLGKLGEFLDWILLNMDLNVSEKTGLNPDLSSLIIIIGAAVLALIIISVVILIRRLAKKRNNSLDEIFAGISESDTPLGLLSLARGMFSSGNPGVARDAVRFCFAAVLLSLDEKNIIRVSKWKTNNQLRRELNRTAPAFIPAFSSVMESFNIVWFGHKNISGEEFADLHERASGLVAEVERFEQVS